MENDIRSVIREILNESDPQHGTGKKPKGSGRRLYTDENPKDTVSVKFRTKEDIVDTLNKPSFKSKSHKRQSQIINLIHQRVRAAYQNAKDPETKKRLKRALEYAELKKEQSKKKTMSLRKENKLREKIRNIIQENYQEELMDMILDKISKYGEKSLNPHEKNLLDKISTGKEILKNDLDLIFDFLDFNLGELKPKTYVQNKLGKKVSGIKYFDKSNNYVFDLEVESEVLGIKKEANFLYADDELLQYIKLNFTISDPDAKEVIKRWFEKTTDEKVSKIDFWISGE
jgi:hypothetical protein